MRPLPHPMTFVLLLQIVAGVGAALKPAQTPAFVAIDMVALVVGLGVRWWGRPGRTAQGPRPLAIHHSRTSLRSPARKEATP